MTSNKFKMLLEVILMAVIICISTFMADNSIDTRNIVEEYNGARFDKSVNEKTPQFLVKAEKIDIKTISLGQ